MLVRLVPVREMEYLIRPKFGTLHDDPDVGEGLHKEGPMEVLDLYDPELDWSAQSPD